MGDTPQLKAGCKDFEFPDGTRDSEHESTLILYEAAAKALKEQGVKKLPDLYALKAEYKRLAEEKERLYEQYGEAKKRMQEYGIIKQNVDGILRVKPGKEWTQEL